MEAGKKELDSSKRKEHTDADASSSAAKKRRVFIPYSSVPRGALAVKKTGYTPRPSQPNAPPRNTGAPAAMTCNRPANLTCFS